MQTLKIKASGKETANKDSGAGKVKLFSVTLDWACPAGDEGDYATRIWARNSKEAIRLVAEEMADSGEKCFDTKAERIGYIKEVVLNADIYAAIEICASLGPDIETLMMGPEGEWSPQARRDLDRIKSILSKYGVAQ